MNRYQKSLLTYEESHQFLVPDSNTISKSPHLFPYGAYPIYLVKGKGCLVEDIDGNQYIDYQGALGANILGIAYGDVVNAVTKQAQAGSLFSLGHPLAIQVAKQLCEMIPSAKRVRLLKNGSDATSAAIRIARAYTKREHIAFCHFHGWHDWYYVVSNLNYGIPSPMKQWIHPFSYNDISSLEAIFTSYPNQVAAVIMEAATIDEPKNDFLNHVKQLTEKAGALLIFDEVVTGFRFALGGAQEFFQVTPHLSCFAKALSNGSSLAAIVGQEEIMMSTQNVVTSMTFAEETLALAAALTTLNILKNEPVVQHIFNLGQLLKEGVNSLASQWQVPIICRGYPPRLELIFDKHPLYSRDQVKGYFLEQMAMQGILIGRTIFISYSHTKADIKKTLKAFEKVFKDLATLKHLELKGALPKELW